jgi:hypothetical protein
MSQAHKRYARGNRGNSEQAQLDAHWQTLRITGESHQWNTPSEESASRSTEFSESKCGIRAPRSHLTVQIQGPKCAECEA